MLCFELNRASVYTPAFALKITSIISLGPLALVNVYTTSLSRPNSAAYGLFLHTIITMVMPPSTKATLMGYFPQNGPGITDVVVETILLFLGYVSIGLRLWSRRIQRARLQLNDWLILFAMVRLSRR